MGEQAERFTVEQAGSLWRVTDTETGESFLHHSEIAARNAARPDIATGVTPETVFGPVRPPSTPQEGS